MMLTFPSLTAFRLRFTPSCVMALFALLLIALLMRLGFWQLERASEKKQWIQAYHNRAHRSPVLWPSGDKLPKQYQPIVVYGYYLPVTFLLDNQHYRHQFGYDILSSFILPNGKVLLVDRGWMLGDASRLTFPAVTLPEGMMKLVGSAYYPSEKSWVLGQVLEKKCSNLAIIERIDLMLISQFLHKSVYPFIMRLHPQAAHGYVRDWAVVSMPPERHYGYALQWFAMAMVVLIIFIALTIKRVLKKR